MISRKWGCRDLLGIGWSSGSCGSCGGGLGAAFALGAVRGLTRRTVEPSPSSAGLGLFFAPGGRPRFLGSAIGGKLSTGASTGASTGLSGGESVCCEPSSPIAPLEEALTSGALSSRKPSVDSAMVFYKRNKKNWSGVILCISRISG